MTQATWTQTTNRQWSVRYPREPESVPLWVLHQVEGMRNAVWSNIVAKAEAQRNAQANVRQQMEIDALSAARQVLGLLGV